MRTFAEFLISFNKVVSQGAYRRMKHGIGIWTVKVSADADLSLFLNLLRNKSRWNRREQMHNLSRARL